MNSLHTIGSVIEHVERSYSNPAALNYFEEGRVVSISTESFIFDLKRLTFGLLALGLKKGDAVGVLSDSSPLWSIADLAIIMAGGMSVPLFSKMSHENFIYECAQANARFLFVQGEDHWKMYDEHRNLFEKVIALDEPLIGVDGAIRYHDVLHLGEELWKTEPKLWDELVHQQNGDDICTIIYTAGSSGMPKGVQLSHQNLCHLVNFKVFSWDNASDSYLSILPLAHVFARQINLILIGWGVSIYYLNDLSQMPAVCKEIKPSLMIVVPRVLEKMFAAIEGKIKSDPKNFKNRIVRLAFSLACDPSQNWIKKYFLRSFANALVYKQMHRAFGGRFRVILCGGAALDKTINRFFINIGIPVYEGWGLTEASTACVNTPGNVRVGTVGKPLPGVQVKLGQNDELLLSGPTIMKGYYRHPEATRAVIDEEGWFHTGDKGAIDKDGFVKIVGRVKEQFKLSSGEYVVPGRIEYMLTQHPLIDMAMVVGEKKKYASCLLFFDVSSVRRIKKERHMEDLSDEGFLQSSYVKEEIQTLIGRVNQKVNAWEKLVQYHFIMKTPTIENGQLTPTLKLRRDVILQVYQDVINNMYAESR